MEKKKKSRQEKGKIFVKGMAAVLAVLMVLSVGASLIYALI